MQETTFFEYEGVRITNSRFIVDGQTFAMNNITSVKPMEEKPKRLLPALLIIFGILPAVNGAYGALLLSLIGTGGGQCRKPSTTSCCIRREGRQVL